MHRPYRGALGQHNGHAWQNQVDSDDMAEPKSSPKKKKKKKKKRKDDSDGENSVEEEGHCEVLNKGNLLEAENRELANVAVACVIPTHEHFKIYREESEDESGGESKGTDRQRNKNRRNNSDSSDDDSDDNNESKGTRRKHRNRK